MDNLAWHYDPVHTSDFFIRADLSVYGMPGRFEQLWAKRVTERTFKICCVPFFTYGIALGDTVETDEEFTFQRIVHKEGHRVLRIAIANNNEQAGTNSIVQQWVMHSGLQHEWYSSTYVAVDLPLGLGQLGNKDILEDLEHSGKISVEIVE